MMTLLNLDLRDKQPQRLWPTDLPQRRPVLLTDIYPFARRRSHQGVAWIELQSKLMIILGKEITFAGSTLLHDKVARTLFARNMDFFREGVILPDLEDGVESFQDRLRKYDTKLRSPDLVRYARRLDDTVRTVISFKPSEVSSNYATQLAAYSRHVASLQYSNQARDRFERFTELIEKANDPIPLSMVAKLSRALPEWREFTRLGEFLYCVTGADIVAADGLYSKHYKPAQVELREVHPSDQTQLEITAAKSLFSYFAVDLQKVGQLLPSSVLKLRDDVRIRYGVEAMRSLIVEARHRVAEGMMDEGGNPSLREASDELRSTIEHACAAQARRERLLNAAADIVYDFSPVPFTSLARKGLAKLEDWLAGTRHLGGLDRPLAPLATFASVIQHEAVGASGERDSRK